MNAIVREGNLEELPWAKASAYRYLCTGWSVALAACRAVVLCQPLSLSGTFRWHVTCPGLWKYWFWNHIPEPVSVFLPSQTGANLKLRSSSSHCNALKVAPSPFAVYTLQEVLPTSSTIDFQLWQNKPQHWTPLLAEVCLRVTQGASPSPLPVVSLHRTP